MKVGIIIPDRGDRHEFMENCKRMLDSQSKNSFCTPLTMIIGGDPKSNEIDITARYRKGYELASHSELNNHFDILAFMENDDWYAADYLETMLTEWDKAGRPDMFGTNYTIYYHLKLRKYYTMRHSERSSAMSMLIKPGLKIVWPQDNDPYTDQWLWLEPMSGIKDKVVFEPNKIICIGMKHGQGLCGGGSHTTDLHRYINDDANMHFLKNTMDEESFEFYQNYSKKLNQIQSAGIDIIGKKLSGFTYTKDNG